MEGEEFGEERRKKVVGECQGERGVEGGRKRPSIGRGKCGKEEERGKGEREDW